MVIFNKKNEMLITKRADSALLFPGAWTNSCSGHPRNVAYETEEWNKRGYKYAARRVLEEQLGIAKESLYIDDLMFMMRGYYKAAAPDGVHGEHELTAFLVMWKDVEVRPNPEHVSDYRWITSKDFFFNENAFVGKSC